jgi:hypothetical protein
MTGRRRNVAADLATWRRVHFFVQIQRLKMKDEPRARDTHREKAAIQSRSDGPIERAAKKFHKSPRQIERILAKYTPMTAVDTDIRLKFQAVDTAIATTAGEAFTRVGSAISDMFTTSVKPMLEDYATIKRNLTESELKLLEDADAPITFALGIAKDRERVSRLAQRKRKVTDKK